MLDSSVIDDASSKANPTCDVCNGSGIVVYHPLSPDDFDEDEVCDCVLSVYESLSNDFLFYDEWYDGFDDLA